MNDEQERLEALYATNLLDTPPDPPFDDVARVASRLLDTPIALINLVDADRQWTKAAVGMPQGSTMAREDAFCPRMIPTGQPLIVPDTHEDPRFAHNPNVLGAPFFRFYAGVPIFDRAQHVLGALCVLDRVPRGFGADELNILQDLGRVVSRLIEAEVRLGEARRAEANLESAQADVQSFFTNAPSLMCIAAPSGRFVQLSREWETALGHPIGALLNKPVLHFIHPEDRQAALLAMSALGEGHNVLDFVARFRAADDSYVPIRWFSSPSKDGGIIYAVAQDVSKEMELERLRREFVSMVSHELRTPLSSINGTMRLLSAGVVGELPPEAVEMVDMASKNCRRLIRLANDLLDLERLRSGQLHMEVAPLRTSALLRRVHDELEVLAAEKDLRLVLECSEDASISGDEDRLVQVLVNLGSNAVRHTPSGGRVTFRCTPDGLGMVRVEVRDTGPGIPPHEQQRVFERFVQLKNDGRVAAGGTGLGLAISREIVVSLGGDIGVESPPGEGACFWIRLPRVLEIGDSVSGQAPTLPRPFVRVLTDDPESSLELVGALRGAGYDVRVVQRRDAPPATPDATILDTRWGPPAPEHIEDTDNTLIVTHGPSRLAAPGVAAALHWSSNAPTLCLLGWLRKRTRHAGAPRVLVVEDDPEIGAEVLRGLRAQRLSCTRVADGTQALALISGFDPDLIVLDVRLPRVDGFRFVTELRRQFVTGVPMLIYTAQRLDAFRKDALRLGETRFLDKAEHGVDEVVEHAKDMLNHLRRQGEELQES